MALYTYRKSIRTKRKSPILSLISTLCIVAGLGILAWVAYPILSFELFYSQRIIDQSGALVGPIPTQASQNQLEEDLASILGSSGSDYTKASVWFPKAVRIQLARSQTSYTLSIPKFGIDNANVLVGSDDLDKSLIHFTGPLPGEYGNPVIFGHSTIPWLYNPKDYKTIFSHLPELTPGDDIFVTSDSITYRYKVQSMKVVSPDDLSVLDQQYDYSYITLITCVPPGTYLKRLIVRGRLATM